MLQSGQHRDPVVYAPCVCLSVAQPLEATHVTPCLALGRGGIQDGDIIVKVNGRPLADSSELQEAVLTESPLLLEVRRGNDDLLFSIVPEVVL